MLFSQIASLPGIQPAQASLTLVSTVPMTKPKVRGAKPGFIDILGSFQDPSDSSRPAVKLLNFEGEALAAKEHFAQ
jgi:hypothetical protein